MLLVGLGVIGVIAYLNARDDATVSKSEGPGSTRPAGEQPVVDDGNVLLLYSDPQAEAPLRALKSELAGSGAALANAGQAVLVRRARDVPGIAALSSRHRLNAPSPDDPPVREFVEYWLGRKPG